MSCSQGSSLCLMNQYFFLWLTDIYRVDISHFIYPVISLWTFGFFPLRGYCAAVNICMLDFCVDIHFHFTWVYTRWVPCKLCLPFFIFFWLRPRHMEVPTPGIESEPPQRPRLQLQQHQILSPPAPARDQTHAFAATRATTVRFLTHHATMGTPSLLRLSNIPWGGEITFCLSIICQ